jgi:hypothetical protein
MSQVEIFIDPNHADHLELEEGLRDSLKALKSISVTEEKKPVPPGTLSPGLDHVIAYVVHHQDAVSKLAAAMLNIVSNLLRFRSTKSEKEQKSKPVVIVVKEERLSLPASEATQKKFLQRIEAPTRGKEAKKSSRRATKANTKTRGAVHQKRK